MSVEQVVRSGFLTIWVQLMIVVGLFFSESIPVLTLMTPGFIRGLMLFGGAVCLIVGLVGLIQFAHIRHDSDN